MKDVTEWAVNIDTHSESEVKTIVSSSEVQNIVSSR